MSKYTRVRGTQDFLPERAELLHFINESAVSFFENYGYRLIITPTFENSELFKRSVGESTDIIQKEMYEFKDKGGRDLALRPEGTASVVRAYIENNLGELPKPVKLIYVSQMFRYERPQAGRYREFWQIGAEAIGSPDPALDAEVIELCLNFLNSLAVKDLKLIINSMGCRNCRPGYIKVLKKFLSEKEALFCKTCSQRIEQNPLRVFDCKQKECQKVLSEAPKISDYICEEDKEHFEKVKIYLKTLNVEFVIDPHLVRGFDYYTRTAFEITLSSLGSQDAIAGGGRYDYLIKDYGGPDEPAIGFAFGTERIMLAFENQNITVFTEPEPDVFVAWVEEAQKSDALRISAMLREKHLRVSMAFDSRKLKSQLKLADKLNANTALIVGEEEIKSGKYTFKDLESAKQEKLTIEEVVNKFKDNK